MPGTHLRELDLNLLVLFDALLRHRRVTEAGEELGLSQSGASRALGRLRRMLADPLFIVSGDGLMPTPRALALEPDLSQVIHGVRRIVNDAPFEPSQAHGAIRIMMPDHLALALSPRLLRAFAQQAPGLELIVNAFSKDWRADLERGEVELAFGVVSTVDSNLRRQSVFEDPWVVVMRAGHPAGTRKLTARRFAEERHGMMAVTGRGGGQVDEALAKVGLRRRVVFRSTSPVVVAMMAMETDLLVTTTALLANTLARHFPLVIRSLPVDAKALELPLLWHERDHADARHRWLRSVVGACLREASCAV